MSAPVPDEVRAQRWATPPKWLNPCSSIPASGLGSGFSDSGSDSGAPPPPVSEVLDKVVLQVVISIGQINHFKEEFLQRTFPGAANEDFAGMSYSWLPNLPRGQPPPDHLEALTVPEALRSAYENLQKFAVGMEQVVWTQEDNRGPFLDKFRQAETNLQLTLCEVLTAMQELQIRPPPDVGRDLMAEGFRSTDNPDVRDWIILRDYANALQYLHDVLTHLRA